MPNSDKTIGDIDILQLLDVPLALLPKFKHTCLWCQARRRRSTATAICLWCQARRRRSTVPPYHNSDRGVLIPRQIRSCSACGAKLGDDGRRRRRSAYGAKLGDDGVAILQLMDVQTSELKHLIQHGRQITPQQHFHSSSIPKPVNESQLNSHTNTVSSASTPPMPMQMPMDDDDRELLRLAIPCDSDVSLRTQSPQQITPHLRSSSIPVISE